jgi:2-haloacid dehalogenase
MSKILVFDVNETLLDLSALAPEFASVFGDAALLGEWFNQVILFAMGLTLANAYRTFGEIGVAALQMLADAEGAPLSEEQARRIAGGIRSLPPHPEVPGALQFLKDAGFRLVTLTNSPLAVVGAQMANAELQPFFERNFSVDTVRRFKPAPEPYRMVAEELAVEAGELWMIAAHAWDVGGAMQVGYRAAFVARPGKAPYPLFPKPAAIGGDLREVAEAIVKFEREIEPR